MKPLVIVLTGASGGIGFYTAQQLCEQGHTVYGISRSKPADPRILHVPADVSDESAVRDAFAHIIRQSGRIDVLINNAGFGISGAVEFTQAADARRLMDVNFMGVFHCCKAVIGCMRQNGGGRILNISSVAAPLAIPFQAFYSASKAAVSALSAALDNEVRRFGIRVCAVLPGDIKTGFTSARQKSTEGAEVYGEVIARSVAAMEHDEQNGMSPHYAAKKLCRWATGRSFKPVRVIGNKYRLFCLLQKLLPAAIVNKIIGMLYAR
ncbi:MAG: SDR family NAD(P)-dependent oxidoreductase [Clostridia bacterium]|nr:SDR family NAD(P)-dependent oxidoreductase [Clostridia bacterium]